MDGWRLLLPAGLRTLANWVSVGLGCAAGLFACASLGRSWVPAPDDFEAGLRWLRLAGVALFGLSFLLGSILALNNRRSAATTLLAVMPVAAFCLAYPGSGFIVWGQDSGWFTRPLPEVALGLTALFYAPLFALSRTRGRSASILAFVAGASIVGLAFAYSLAMALLLRLIVWSIPFLIMGMFWRETERRGWPPVVRARAWSRRRRVLAAVSSCVIIVVLGILLTLALVGLRSSLAGGDCHAKPPFMAPSSPMHAVFTAKVLFAGRSISSVVGPGSIFRGDPRYTIQDSRAGDWAIGMVQEKFWGMPDWTRFVLLTNYIYWEGETYFIDGLRDTGLLTRFLPVVEAGIGCSRTQAAQGAVTDLHLLRKQPSSTRARLVGHVLATRESAPELGRPPKLSFVAGAEIHVVGPAFSWTVTTDSSGVYEVDDLAPGDYTLQPSNPNIRAVVPLTGQESPVRIHLNAEELLEQNFESVPDRAHEPYARPSGTAHPSRSAQRRER